MRRLEWLACWHSLLVRCWSLLRHVLALCLPSCASHPHCKRCMQAPLLPAAAVGSSMPHT